MAEHLNQTVEPLDDGFAAMGKPIPLYRKQAAFEHCREIGLDTPKSWAVVNDMSDKLQRDKPYEAQAGGMKYLDLTGTYRIMAVLLTSPEPVQ